MSITVISQSTAERKQETIDLFNQIKPYLDKGIGYMNACIQIGRCQKNLRNHYYQCGWFRDLKEYGASQGYPYHKYSGKGVKR